MASSHKMDPSVNYVYQQNQQRPRSRGIGSTSGSSSTIVAADVSSRIRSRSPLTVHRQEERSPSVNNPTNSHNSRTSHPSNRHRRHQVNRTQPSTPTRRAIFYLTNADSNISIQNNNRYHIRSIDSVLQEPSYISVGRQRHLMESKRALNIPPIATFICLIHLIFYLFREELFHITKPEDVYVTWELVWNKKQFWRLFVAQFFHFNRLNMLINSATLFAVGRYLERKVTALAMIIVIIVMSAITHFLYILINPICIGTYCCKEPYYSEFMFGFGNVIYSLRVVLAYALEPRNYERDLVFGLYPMVVSASHAPWQPILDLIIFKVVLPEQCITGQVSGIIAGFLVTAVLLLWPSEGVYIANPPYYWTLMGTRDPNDEGNRETHDDDRDDRGDQWRMSTFTNSNFWLPSSSHAMVPPSTMQSMTSTQERTGNNNSRVRGLALNPMKIRSEETKAFCKLFLKNPKQSVVHLVRSLTTTQQERDEDERRKQIREEQKQKNLIRRINNAHFKSNKSEPEEMMEALDAKTDEATSSEASENEAKIIFSHKRYQRDSRPAGDSRRTSIRKVEWKKKRKMQSVKGYGDAVEIIPVAEIETN